MGSKQRLPLILSLAMCNLRFPVLLIIFIPSSLQNSPAEVEGSNNDGFFTISPPAVLPICSESALLSTHKIHRLRGTQGIFVKKVENIWQVPYFWVSSNVTTNFSLVENDLSCTNGGSIVALPRYDTEESINSTSKHFYPNGYFRYNRHIYAPDEYCIESFSEFPSNSSDTNFQPASVQIRLCIADCDAKPCIRKCCPLNQIFRGGPGGPGRPFCVTPPPGSASFMPTLYKDYYSEAIVDIPNPHFIINHPRSFKKRCEDGVILPIPFSNITSEVLGQRLDREFHHWLFRIRIRDGAVMFKLDNKCDTVKNLNNICIDGVNGAFEEELENPFPFNNTEAEYILFQCQIPEKDQRLEKLLSVTFGGLLLATSIFPLITCVVYLLLWKKQNVHGRSIAATSGSLFFMYIFQGSAHLIGVTLKTDALNTFYCKQLAILIHFFMMSTFTWLTVMSCDLWLTFRSVVPMMNQRLHGVTRYVKYSAFGWGIPFIIVTIGILMDFVIKSPNDCSYHAVPAYGQQSCWIMEDALGEYLYYPAAFLVCVNILLFTATCVKLCMYGRGPTVRTRKNDAFGDCFSRFTKLFCVMGISWIFEIVSWQVDGLGFVWYWNIFDIFNILRAVAIFAIYVCKKDIIIQLEDAYPALQGILRPFSRLFLRKCSEEMSTTTTESTAVYSAAPSSPRIPLKTGVNPKIVRNKKRSGNLLEVQG